MENRVIAVTAVAEVLFGLALVVVPDRVVGALFGLLPELAATKVARIAGAALVALGVAGWSARSVPPGPGRTAVVRAVTVYNVAAVAVYAGYGVAGLASGVILWLAAAFHLGLAAAGLAARLRQG